MTENQTNPQATKTQVSWRNRIFQNRLMAFDCPKPAMPQQTQPKPQAKPQPTEPASSNYRAPVAPPDKKTAITRAKILIEAKIKRVREAAYIAISAPGVSCGFVVAKSQAADIEEKRLNEQVQSLSAALAVFAPPTPHEEIVALAAVHEHYTRGAKIAGAARLFRLIGNTLTFEVWSSDLARKLPYMVTFNHITNIAFCNCDANKECWHIRAARHGAMLYLLCDFPVTATALITIDNFTTTAFDAVDALDDVAVNRNAARIDKILGSVREFALQGAGDHETRVMLDDMMSEVRGLICEGGAQ